MPDSQAADHQSGDLLFATIIVSLHRVAAPDKLMPPCRTARQPTNWQTAAISPTTSPGTNSGTYSSPQALATNNSEQLRYFQPTPIYKFGNAARHDRWPMLHRFGMKGGLPPTNFNKRTIQSSNLIKLSKLLLFLSNRQ